LKSPWVQSTDPATGKTSAQPVTALYLNHDTDLVDVTVANDKGQTTVLHTTWHHPFWDETTHEWTEAADLEPGTQLRSANGSVEYVVAIRTWTGLDWMHDLTVANTHTYYVIAGDTPVLVHNDGGYIPAPKGLPGFPNARRVKPRTAVQGGGGMRARWEDKKFIYEWDSQHGEVEKYNKKGKHLGAFDPNTGEMMTDSKGRPKGPTAGRTCGL
jgi:hypothetical protein